MMGRTHAMSGAVAAVAVLPALDSFGVEVNGWSLVVATVAAAGGAMLPDLDHPNATVAHALGSVTRATAKMVEALSGGHRNGTHSLLGCLVFAGLTYGITQAGPIATGLWLAFLFAIAAAAAGVPVVRNRQAHTVVCLVAAAVLVPLGMLTYVPVGALPWAVGIGAAAHLVGDAATKQGVPLAWPLSRTRLRFANVTTGGPFDTAASWLLAAVLAVQVVLIARASGFAFPSLDLQGLPLSGWFG